ELLPAVAARRARSAALLSDGLAQIEGVRPLPPQPAISRETLYCYVFQYRREAQGVPRDLFAAALEAEGIPCDGRFYEAVYRSDLFHTTLDYSTVHCPVADRAAYHESVWVPQFVLLGGDDDVRDALRAIEKVMKHLGDLQGADPALAGAKSASRARRPERDRNY